jgi:ribonuclease PH
MRADGRANNQLRPVKMTTDFICNANGSVLIEFGRTKVICTATVEDKVPPFLKGTGKGWVTGEYAMLPASTQTRKPRESSRGKVEGRTQEIQRLIGRALRSVVDLDAVGERTIWIDCDVIQADGGTRTASITGSFVALTYCIHWMLEQGMIQKSPIQSYVAAVSVGIHEENAILDLCYEEDSNAKVDMNIVMTDKGEYIEIQGTGEESPFSQEDLLQLLQLGQAGINDLIKIQKEALGSMSALVGGGTLE